VGTSPAGGDVDDGRFRDVVGGDEGVKRLDGRCGSTSTDLEDQLVGELAFRSGGAGLRIDRSP